MKLVGEFVAGTAASRSLGTSTLNHEIGNDTMKNEAIVKRLAGLGAFRERDEILDGLGRAVGKQAHFEFSFRGIEQGIHFVRHEGDSSRDEGVSSATGHGRNPYAS